MNHDCMRDAAYKWAAENFQPREELTLGEREIAISAAAEGYFACLMEQAGKVNPTGENALARRQSLTSMPAENGITNQWYFECDGHYIDVARCQNGLYSILFVDRLTKARTWFDQGDAISNAIAKREIPLVTDASYLIEDALQFARDYAEKKSDNKDLVQACDRAIFILRSSTTTVDENQNLSDRLEYARCVARTKAFQDMLALLPEQRRHIENLMTHDWQIVSVELKTLPGLIDPSFKPLRYSVSTPNYKA